MRSVFVNSSFSRFDLGTHILSRGLNPQMGFSFKDLLPGVGLSPSDIDKIQDPAVRAEFKTAYQRCEAKGLDSVQGIGCLAELAAKVYAKLNEQATLPITPIKATNVPTDSFPIVPVAIAGLAAAALIWFLATRGKK